MSSCNISVCCHVYFPISKKGKNSGALAESRFNLEFCKKCGVMRYNQTSTLKPADFDYKCELDQVEQFKDMLTKSNEILTIDYENEVHTEYLSKRAGLVEYLKEIVQRYQYGQSVFYLAVYFLDYIMIKNPGVGCQIALYVCFLLAGKFYEANPTLPACWHIASAANSLIKEGLAMNCECQQGAYYQPDDIKKSEIICLQILGYNLNRPTAFDFLQNFLKNGILFEDEVLCSIENLDELSSVYNSSFEILDFLVADNRFLDFSPLEIACAIVTFIRKEQMGLKLKQAWSKRFEHIYNIKLNDFMNCYFVLNSLVIVNVCENMNISEQESQFYLNDSQCHYINNFNCDLNSSCETSHSNNSSDFIYQNSIKNYFLYYMNTQACYPVENNFFNY